MSAAAPAHSLATAAAAAMSLLAALTIAPAAAPALTLAPPETSVAGATAEPIPHPTLDRLPADARESVLARRQTLEALEADASASAADLAAAYGELGKAYLTLEQVAAAEATLRNAAALDPLQPRWLYYLGLLALERGDFTGAADRFEAVTRLRPDEVAAWVRRGNALYDADLADESDRSFARALELDSTLAAAHYGRGRAALRRADDATAIRALETALELQPEARKIHALLAQAYRRSGQADLAARHAALYSPTDVVFPEPFVAELRLETSSAAFHAAAGDRASIDGRDEFAARSYERALELDPDDPRARQGLASVAERQGDFERAVAQYEEAARRAPSDPQPRAQLGRLLARRGASSEARDQLQAALELDPDDEETRLLFASVSSALGDHEAALAACDLVLARSPQHRGALLERASVLRSMGRPDQAQAELERILALQPADPSARINLAMVLADQGQVERAGELLDTVATDPASPSSVRAVARYNRGVLRVRAQEDDAAILAFEEAIALDPELDDARFQLATALGRRGQYAEAARRYEELLSRQPGNVGARLAHATALLLDGQAAAARDTLVAGLGEAPGSPDLAHALARLLAGSPDHAVRDGQRALELATSVFQRAKTMEHAETVAMAYAEIGAFEEAVRWQRTLLTEAERLGDEGWIARLRANLERYERRERP